MIEQLIAISIYFLQDKEIIKEILDFQKNENENIDSIMRSEKFACKEGCYYCCIGWDVKGTIPEMMLVVNSLNRLNDDEKFEIAKRLEKFKQIKNFDDVPCPLLDNGNCIVYESRPFICRTFSSYDENLCKNKISFEFPEVVQKAVEYSKESIDKLDDFFKPLFNTKIRLSDILFNKEKRLFYINIADTALIYLNDGNVEVLKGEYAKKYLK